MTRAELAANLSGLLAPYGIPVVADPLDAVIFPAVVVDNGSPWRERTTVCWTKTWELLMVAGRMDDPGVYTVADETGDTLCNAVVGLDGIVNQGAASAPAMQTIGAVDCLTATFRLTDYNLGPGRPC